MAEPTKETSQQIAAESRERHRAELRTLVFTDIVGSVRLKQTLGDRAGLALIERHDSIIRELVATFNAAEEIGVAGDSFTLAFAKPSDAVQFALMLQARLRVLSAESEHAILDRIGIHVGEVLVHSTPGQARPIGGIQIDTCARLMELASGDQILLSRFAFDSARQALRGWEMEGLGALTWLNHGHYSLKGVEEPLEVCEVGETGRALLKPPANSPKAHRIATHEGEPVLGWRPASGQPVPGTSWVLEKNLGEGGFGEVWLGVHAVLKQRRVFKFCFRADRVRSLKREVTLFRILRERIGAHPNIVAIDDVYFDEPPFYIVMDYVEGASLDEWARRQSDLRAVPLELRLEIVAQVADGLQAAHEAGVIHRDVKPSNILVAARSGTLHVKLTDFGIGQVVSAEALHGVTQLGFTQTLISTASASGTQLYMAPELLTGHAATTRSDIYALGVVLFQLIVGDLARPLTVDWAEAIDDPLLRDDLRKCFASEPAQRFAGAAQLAANLRALPRRRAAAEEERARLAVLERHAYRRGLLRAAVVAVIVIGLVAGLAIFGFRQARRARESARNEVLARNNAESLLAKTRIDRAQDFFAAGDAPMGLAYLAAVVRQDPKNPVAAERLLSALRDRAYPLPISGSLEHDGMVIDATFSPDGKRLAAVTPNSVTVWETATGKPRLGPLPFGGFRAVFSPDGSRLAVMKFDARIFDAATGNLVLELDSSPTDGGGEARPDLSWSADGTKIVTIAANNDAQLWDARTGARLGAPLTHPGEVWCAQFSPDGRRLATGGHGGAFIREVASGKLLHELTSEGRIERIAFSPDGERLVTGALSGAARLWSVSRGEPLGREMRHDGQVSDVTFSPDGLLVLTTAHTSETKLWDGLSAEPRGEFPRGRYRIWSGRFSADGRRVVTRTGEGVALVWDLTLKQLALEPIRPDGFPLAAVFSPDANSIATACSDGRVRLWEVTRTAAAPLRLAHGSRIRDARFDESGGRAITAGTDGRARVWDLQSGRNGQVLRHGSAVRIARFFPDGNRAITAGEDATVRLWELAKAEPIGEPIRASGSPVAAELSADGRMLLLAGEGGSARVWDTQTQRPVTAEFSEKVWAAALAPDGRTALLASGNSAAVWDTATGRRLSNEAPHKAKVACVAFTSDGRRFVTGSFDGSTRLWDAATGAPLSPEMKHGNVVSSLAIDRSGETLITSSYDRFARRWLTRVGAPDKEPLAHPEVVNSVSVHPPSPHRLCTASSDGVRLWNLQWDSPLLEPMRVGGPVREARWSNDGSRILALPENGEAAFVWDAREPRLPPRAPLADWADAVAGKRLEHDGAITPVGDDDQLAALEKVRATEGDDPFATTARWFFASHGERTLSPFSHVRWNERDARFPPRDPNATPAQVDLTPHYNCRLDEDMIPGDAGNTLEELPRGSHVLAGVRFDLRGIVQLGSDSAMPHFPRAVRGIAINRTAARLHFLHAAEFVQAPPQTELARYFIRYADGQSVTFSAIHERDLADWWRADAPPPLEVAWRGSNPFARIRNERIALFKSTWPNPRPEMPIACIDFESANAKAAPFVVAITAE